MPRRVELTERFVKDLNKLDKETRQRVLDALRKLRDDQPVNLKKLTGTEDEWRLKVGVYRVRLKVKDKGITVYALRVLHRREVYRDL